MITLVLALGAYLVGAVPFGLLLGRMRGIDVRRHGSCNIGSTNVGRVLGRRWGLACLALDIAKGLVPTAAAGAVLLRGELGQRVLLEWLAVGVAAVLGHVYPVYLRFRGGKGVATTIGVALGIWPYYTIAMGVALLGYALVRFASGVVSLGSLTIAVLFPLSVHVGLRLGRQPLAESWPLQLVALLLGLLIVVRHRGNIRRLLRGEEMRLTSAGTPEGSLRNDAEDAQNRGKAERPA